MTVKRHQRSRALAAHLLSKGAQGAQSLASKVATGATASASARPNTGSDASSGLTSRRLTHPQMRAGTSRDEFADAVTQALFSLRTSEGSLAILNVDIDRFSTLNDTHGFDAGDEVLFAVADRLSVIVSPAGRISRVGPDEFALLCKLDAPNGTVTELVDRINRLFNRPIETARASIRITISVGAAVVNRDQSAGIDPMTLIRQAESAMQEARRSGRSQFVNYEQSIMEQAVSRYRTEQELRAALQNDKLDVHYQPIINLHSGAIVGLEALARWNHPSWGTVSPGVFIPVAEESGLIDQLGDVVLRNATAQAQRWSTTPLGQSVMTVNLSNRQLLDPHLISRIRDALDEYEIEPGLLCLEITESVVMSDVALSMAVLGGLKDLGVCLAIDDFGTGYSSLSYLRRLPVDILKIDRSFVQSIYNRDDRIITKAIIDLAHTLGMTTVAEGVENRLQVEVLHALECDMAQGFLLHHPVAADEIDMSSIDFSATPMQGPRVTAASVAPVPPPSAGASNGYAPIRT